MIQIFVTGGTLDKDYDPITGNLFFPSTHLPKMLSQANFSLDIKTRVLFKKDSLDIEDADRKIILQACKETESKQIVIIHGTDTMAKTAKYLHLYLNKYFFDKTIILTGAMRPFNLGHSDAMFNLGGALMAVKNTRPGIFVVMNGQLLTAQEVVKNKTLGVFESSI